MNILSIGNSFSVDAQRYLHQIAAADNVKMNTVNLYIPGCPLSLHYRNMMGDKEAYTLYVNGVSTGFPVSIKEALLNRDWDVITLQQASGASVNFDRYQPYLSELASYVRRLCPKAKIVIHQTWAYKKDSELLCEKMGYPTVDDMFRDVRSAYEKAVEAIRADFMIPSGEVMLALNRQYPDQLYRDERHASYGLGRYALGLTWYRTFTGRSVLENTFSAFDAPVSPEEVQSAKECVEKLVCGQY